jgi:hypothetical protein
VVAAAPPPPPQEEILPPPLPLVVFWPTPQVFIDDDEQ